MTLENFLCDLNESFKRKAEEKRSRVEAQMREEKLKKEYLRDFNEVYSKCVVRKIKRVEKNLSKDFKIKYKTPLEQFNREQIEGSILFYPKFISGVYEVKLSVRGHYKTQELTITGSAVYRLHARHKEDSTVFKDTIRNFDSAQVENYISQVLRHYFIES
ncbi:hypothetical protein WG947_11315 [Pontibacter sp. H259]|uniref:hypothetical protein n=1 Tax=Pontibacter sp. H259 TaxID=3133421 RepID=UPI0030BD68A9